MFGVHSFFFLIFVIIEHNIAGHNFFYLVVFLLAGKSLLGMQEDRKEFT